MHTKGPWRLNGKRVEYGPIIAGDGFCVAIVSRDPREAEENARLIAAAPALLEALEEAERVIRWAAQEAAGRVKSGIVGGWLHHADKCAAAIAKATK